ncbi:GNAT family N-acetyltransferase [Catelliglobosispora koreensis]|uniref:GNAT family N-acetyltransferase n=1 Tax=Catelliglobosispora koreensis TaxID=129052 RepID=UPI00058CB91D|nr:GNAT family N-acetyltransferase [Catelliglobosispora koreensis]
MTTADAQAVLDIFAAGIAGGMATFETETPGWERFDAARLPDHRWVAEHDGTVLGWAAVSQVSARPAYAGVAEHSVYVHPHAHGQGVGSALLEALIASTEAAGIWTIQSGVFPENTASLALHAKHGFRTVGVRHRPGKLRGVWRDVVAIERRSTVTGIE